MNKAPKSLLFMALAIGLGLSACTPTETDQSSDLLSSSQPTGQEDGFANSHYDEGNFLAGEREVNKTKVVYYDGPSMLETSDKVSVKVENEDLFVYETRVNHKRVFTFEYSEDMNAVALFDFEGKVHVDVTFNDVTEITSAKVSPLVYGIEPTASGNTLSFDLSYNDNYVVEVNGDSENVLHLFANPLETDPITEEEAAKDDKIIYFGPGLYDAGAIPVETGTTVYLAGGAYVYGKIRMEDVEDVTIRGRGIISGSIYDRRMDNEYTIPVEVRTSDNINFEGITFLDPAGWCFALYKSSNITLDNVKIITARGNGDGISVQSCSDVTVTGGFVRTWDDSLVVKNEDRGSTKNITFDGVNVWTDLAQSMEVGYETNGPTMEGITFKNITVIHNFHKAVISMHNCDDATISDVSYENITLEDGEMLGDVRNDGENDFFLDFTIAYNVEWSVSGGNRGKVNGVNVEDVKVYRIDDTVISRINGENDESSIDNVTIKNVDYAGKSINSAADLGLVSNEYVNNLSVSSDKSLSDIKGAIKKLPYKLNITDTEVEKTKIDHVEQEGVLVPSFAYRQGDAPYIGVAADTSDVTVSATHGVGVSPRAEADDGSGPFHNPEHPLENVLDGKSDTYVENGEWTGEAEEFMALSFEFASPKTVGTIRIHGLSANEFKYHYRLAVFVRRIRTDGTYNNFTRTLTAADYDMSPADGNIIDVNISADSYGGVQLRLYRIDDSIMAAEKYQISEVEFFGPSLTYQKPIVDSTEHNDVYVVGNVVDGSTDGSSYYESKTTPAHIVIDLQEVTTMHVLVLALCPELVWNTRVQNIEISVSDSNLNYSSTTTQFTVIKEAADYTFDPKEGNSVTFSFDEGISLRYLKIVINSNSINGEAKYGAQLAEVSAY